MGKFPHNNEWCVVTEPLKRVPQKNWEHGDCGLACVAMVAKVPYEYALEAFRNLEGKAKTKSFYTSHKNLEEMLAALGHLTKRFRFQSWHSITHHAIVKVNVKKSGSWHWVVYDVGRKSPVVHDPKPGKRKLIQDFRGLKASGYYIAVLA